MSAKLYRLLRGNREGTPRADTEYYNNPHRDNGAYGGVHLKIAHFQTPVLLRENQNQNFCYANIRKMITHGTIARAVAEKPMRDLFSKPLRFLDKGGEPNPTIAKKWEAIDGNDLMERAFTIAREFGFCLVMKVEDPLEYVLIAPDEIKQINYNTQLEPIEYVLNYPEFPAYIPKNFTQNPKERTLPAESVFLIEWNPQKHRCGESALLPIWSICWYMEYNRFFSFKFDAEQSADYLALPVNPTDTNSEIDSHLKNVQGLAEEEEAWEEARFTRKVIAVRKNDIGNGATVDYPQILPSSMKSPQYNVHHDLNIGDAASVQGMTDTQLRGTAGSMMAGSTVDALALQNSIESMWVKMNPYVRAFAVLEGIVPAAWTGKIEPDVQLRVSQLEQAQVANLRIDMLNKLTEITSPEERRKAADAWGLLPIPLKGPPPTPEPAPTDPQVPETEIVEEDRDQEMEVAFNERGDSAEAAWTGTGPLLSTQGPLPYGDHLEERPQEEIDSFLNNLLVKEFYLGLGDIFDGQHPMEIPADAAIGKVIHQGPGDIWSWQIDLERLDRLCQQYGLPNWVAERIQKGQPLTASVGLRAKIRSGKQTNLDVRSVVLTRKPRNKATVIHPA